MLDGRSAGQELRGATSSAYSLWPRFHLRQNSRRAATSHLQQSIDEARIGSGQLACSSISCCCSKARSTHVVTCPAEQLQIETGRADLGRAQGLAAWRSGSQSRARKPPSSPPPSAGQTQQQQPQQHLQAQRQRKEPLQDGPLPPGVSSAAAPVPAPGPAAGESRSSFPQPTGGLQAGFRSTTGVRQSATATSDAAATGGEGADAGLVSEGSGPEGLGLVASLANIGQLPAQQRSLQPPPQQQLQQQQEGAIGARSSDSSSSSSASFTSTSASAARNAAAWPLDAPLLTHRIGACSSWRELSSLVSQHAPRMNAVHVTAVATRLARFSPPLPAVRDDGGGGGGVDADVSGDGNSVESQQQRRRFRQMRRWQRGQEDEELHEWMSFVRSILALVERHAAILDARGIANISWALARALPAPLLQPPSPVVAAVAVAAGAEVGSSETGGQCDMGTAAAAGVAAGMGPRRGEDRAVGLRRRRHHGGDGVAGDEGDGSGEWRQPGGSCTAGGGGEAPAAVRFSALRAAARHTVGRLLALPAADPGEWSKTRERESCRSGGGIMTPRHIANAMWAAASLGVLSAPGPEGREAAAEGLVRQGSTHGGGSGDVEGPRRWVMRALAAARGALRTGGFTEEGISQLVWSVSELGLTPDAAWMEDFYGAARRQASELSAHSAANVLLSLANMATAAAGGHRDGDDDVDDDATDTPAGLAESHLTGRRNRIDSGRANSSGAVAATAPAAVAFLLPSDSWLLSFLVDTAPSLESADPVSLANSVWALSVLMRVRRSQLAAASPLPRSLSPPPPSCWLRHLYGALSQPATLRRFTDAQLGQLVWSLADLSDVRPGGLPLVPSAGMFGLVAAELRRRLVAMADKHFAMASWGMQRLQLRLEQRQHLLQLRQLEEELLQLRPEVEELPRRKRGLIAAAAAAAADRDPDDQQQEQKQLASHVRHSYGRELASSAYSDGQNADWSSAWLAAAEKRMPYMADRWLLLTLQVAAASGECFATAASASSGDGDAVLAWFAVATDAVLLPPRRRMGHLPTPAGTDMGRQSQQHCGDSRMAAGSSATAVSAAAATAIASLGQLLDDQPPSGDGVAAAAATQGGGSGGTNPSGTTPALDGVGPDSRTTASSSSSSRRRRRLLPRLLQALLLAAEACLPPGPALSAVMAAAAAEVLAATLAVHPSGSEGGGGGGAEEATSWTVTELLRCGAALARAGYEPPPAWRQAFFGRVLQLAGVSTAAAAPPPQELRPSHPGFAEATVPSESDRYAAGLPDQASSATAGSADGPDGEDQGPEQQQRRRRQQPLRRHRHGHHLSASDVGLLLSCSQRWAATASDATLAALLYGVPYELWTPRAAAWVCRLLASQVTTQQPQLQQQGLMQQQKQLSPFERNTQGLEQGSAHPLPDQLQPSLPPPSPPPQQQQPCDEGVAHNNNNNNRITSGSGSGGSAGLKAADPFRCEGPATASEALQDPSLTAASPASPLLDQSSAELDPACTQPAAIQGPPPAAPPPPLPEGSVLASSAAAAAATSSAAAAKLDWDVDSDVEDLDCNTGVNGGTRKVAVREYDVVLVAPRPRPLLPGGLMAAGTDGSGSSSSNARGPFPKAGAAGSLSSRAGAAVPDLNGDAAAAASDGPLGEGKGNGGGDGDLPAPASEAGAAVLPYTPGADGAGARRVEVLQRGPGRPAAAAALVTASAAAAQPLWLATGFQPVGAHPHTRGSAMASATAASSSSSAASLPSRPICWSTFSLSQLLWAAARLRLRPSPRQRAVLRITLSAALVRWAAQPPYALIPLLWSCRRLGVPLGAGPTRLLRRALLLHPGLQPAALADGPLLMLLEALLGWRLDPPMEWSRRVPYRLASWLARASPAVAIATAAASPTFAGKLGFRGARWAARTDAGAVGSAAKVGRDSVGPTDSGGRSNSSSNNSGGGGVVEARQLLLVLRALRRLQNAARSEAAGSGGDDDDTRHIGFSRRDGGPQAAPGLRIAAGGSIDADVSSAAPGARPYFFRLQLPPRWSPSWAPVPPSKLATRGSRHGRCRSTPAATLTPLDDALWPELWPMLRIAVRQRLTEVFGLTPGVAAPPATSPRERLAALMCGAACGLVDWEAWGVAAMRRLAGELPPRDYHAWLALAVGLQFRVTRGTLEDLLLAWCIASGPQLDAMSPRQLHTTLRLAGRVAETLLQPLSFDWVSVALRRYSRCITALPPAQLAQVPAVLRRLRRLPPPQWQASYAQLVVRHALPYMSGRSAQAMLRAAVGLSYASERHRFTQMQMQD
ncbi:hypothetical protein VOLCADRAFT_95858 [Volvox carteri f. nagariensis]|uniref:Uncharacterized protein n=1 Tax=Volvox carteri f. nagariensis TaxID=3068 RepID=D8U8K2_VOLCA|nr:uncharacterized protein VOLCADRAFT_95858 [Volvox carteri f. nagariensis]EFJ43936.1 hypothetical protein VOLCADRAFT_95858 [Volvox carteri f. nagariensis]|eukprot:XP_002954948.1 hypothetical protein VOLCADRAFT_95858 [Volvox carteri f. nagariensis]